MVAAEEEQAGAGVIGEVVDAVAVGHRFIMQTMDQQGGQLARQRIGIVAGGIFNDPVMEAAILSISVVKDFDETALAPVFQYSRIHLLQITGGELESRGDQHQLTYPGVVLRKEGGDVGPHAGPQQRQIAVQRICQRFHNGQLAAEGQMFEISTVQIRGM